MNPAAPASAAHRLIAFRAPFTESLSWVMCLWNRTLLICLTGANRGILKMLCRFPPLPLVQTGQIVTLWGETQEFWPLQV